MIRGQVVMRVPWLARLLPHLNEAHTTFEQAPRNQQLSTVSCFTIHFANLSRFMADIKSIAGFHLHPIGQLEGLNSCFELRVSGTLVKMALVKLLDQVQLPPLTTGQQKMI